MMRKKICVLLILCVANLFFAQEFYSELRKKYWEYEENDEKAFKYLNLYLASAKKEKNYSELYQGYDDAIRYSKNKKLQYADSSIMAANLSRESDLIGSSYISKGAVYYFTYRKYQLALNEYLKAYQYTKNAKDKFLLYQNLYHIGVVKSYLGYYDDALEIFRKCLQYFESNTRKQIHQNLLINNRKGYLNTLHQIIIIYQNIGKFQEAEKLTNTLETEIPKDDNLFILEMSYYHKSRGINEFNQKLYEKSIINFNKSLPELKEINDFTWASIVYYYRGCAYSQLNHEGKSISDYKRVDSIFNKYKFLQPVLRKNYERLINYYKKEGNHTQQLYYTNQLLKADSIISSDFRSLSRHINKEYDTQLLLETKSSLEKRNFLSKHLLVLSAVIIVILTSLITYWFKRKKELQIKYDELLIKINTKLPHDINNVVLKDETLKKSKLDPKIYQSLRKKFTEFEKKMGFLEKGITAGKLASQWETNATYISQFMSEYTDGNFNSYINRLRIEYATNKMYNDKRWQKYSVEDIAYASGFSNRQSFSNIFSQYNDIRPADFLKKIKEFSVS